MGVCMLIAGGLAFLANAVGDTVILNISLLLMCSILGLFVFNFPFGKIFLGDAGTYSLGHVVIWLSILLIARNPEISPYAILLIFFWPIMDMLFAIFRRVFGLMSRPMSSPRPPTNTAIQLSNSDTAYVAASDGNIAVPAIKPENIAIPPIRGIGVRCAD